MSTNTRTAAEKSRTDKDVRPAVSDQTTDRESNCDAAAVADGRTTTIDAEAMASYRKHLIESRKKAQENYDSTILKLSGGALGISFAFLKNVVGPAPYQFTEVLLGAWICWGASLAVVIFSFLMSSSALSHAISQVDLGVVPGKPGGWRSTATEYSNYFGGILFVAGIMLTVFFAYHNMEIGN